MVRTYGEVQEDKIPLEKFRAFASVVCRYVQDTYKNLNWKIGTITGSGFDMSGTLDYGPINIGGDNGFNKKGQARIYISVRGARTLIQNDFNMKDLFGKQTPKDLARASRLVFNWIKEEMKKIPD